MRTKLAAILLASLCPASGIAAEVAGTWQGEYTCNQGRTGLTLTITAAEAGALQATFRFYQVDSNPGVPDGCFLMSGTVVGSQVQLQAGAWLYRPLSYVSVDLVGSVSSNDTMLAGSVLGPNCTSFALQRTVGDSNPAICRPPGAPVS